MKTHTKQFPEHQLSDFEVLELWEKRLGKNSLPANLLKMTAFNLIPIFGPHAPSSLYDLHVNSPKVRGQVFFEQNINPTCYPCVNFKNINKGFEYPWSDDLTRSMLNSVFTVNSFGRNRVSQMDALWTRLGTSLVHGCLMNQAEQQSCPAQRQECRKQR